MPFFYPHKPDIASDIKIILFLKEETIYPNTIVLSHPNNNFEHGALIKSLIKEYPKFKEILKVHIKKHEMMYDIACRLSINGIATFMNISYEAYQDSIITIPYLLKTKQIENILSFQNLYDCYQNKIEAAQAQLDNTQRYLSFKENKDFYNYLSALKREKQPIKQKIPN